MNTTEKKLHIFHAGSINLLIEEAAKKFQPIYPKCEILLSAGGSVDCVRRVKEGYPADLLVLADYSLFEALMYPNLANWYLIFASNRMVLAGKPGDLTLKGHWLEVLKPAQVRFGHTNPGKDPCGYRTLMAWKLAEKLYPGVSELLFNHPGRIVFEDAKKMLEALDNNQVDYIFEYGSVAEERMLSFLELEKDINLSDPAREALYKSVSINIDEKEERHIQGLPIAYGLTIPSTAQEQCLAFDFIELMLTMDLEKFGLEKSLKLWGKVPERLSK